MADAFAGKPFTFQVLFVGDTNAPVAVVDATITIFSFSQTGAKQVLVDAAPMVAVVPAEVGRYTYTYLIPSIFVQGDTLFAEMTATDPGLPGSRFLVDDEVSIISTSGSSVGLIAQFVKGG